jgi:hypothetical protein
MLIQPWLRVLMSADTGKETPNPPNPPDPAKSDQETEDDEEEPYDKERAMRLIAKHRQEIKDLKASAKDLPTLRQQLEEAQNKDKSDLERAIARADAAEKRAADLESSNATITAAAKRRTAVMEIRRESAKQGADDDLVVALVDLDKIEFDEDDEPKDVKKIVKAIIDSKPAVKVVEQPKNGPSPTPEKSDLTVDSKEINDQIAKEYKRRF